MASYFHVFNDAPPELPPNLQAPAGSRTAETCQSAVRIEESHQKAVDPLLVSGDLCFDFDDFDDFDL